MFKWEDDATKIQNSDVSNGQLNINFLDPTLISFNQRA